MKTINAATSNINWRASGADRVAQNILNLIRTWQGEAPLVRPMGLNPNEIGRPLSEAAASVRAGIAENIAEYVPDAAVSAIRVNIDANSGSIGIEVDLDGE